MNLKYVIVFIYFFNLMKHECLFPRGGSRSPSRAHPVHVDPWSPVRPVSTRVNTRGREALRRGWLVARRYPCESCPGGRGTEANYRDPSRSPARRRKRELSLHGGRPCSAVCCSLSTGVFVRRTPLGFRLLYGDASACRGDSDAVTAFSRPLRRTFQ